MSINRKMLLMFLNRMMLLCSNKIDIHNRCELRALNTTETWTLGKNEKKSLEAFAGEDSSKYVGRRKLITTPYSEE